MMTVKVNGSTGVNNADVVGKAVSFALGSVRVKLTDGAGALSAVTDVWVDIFGTYYTR